MLLWPQIKKKALGVEFHRQVPIDNYIVDFYCHEVMLAIEIDGSSHDDNEVRKNDRYRQDRLESLGVNFIRFDDIEIKRNMLGVITRLQEKVDELLTSPAPPSKGESQAAC
jgi:very-short-patch-repair endonuclease